MRLLERDLTTVHLKQRVQVRDEEGDISTAYSDEAIPLRMNIQSAGGSTLAQIYGERLNYMKTCKYQGNELKPGTNEKDGICLYVGADMKPDYEIISIKPFRDHWNITLERL